MLVGHLAAGFVGKRLEPKLSLGVLVMAALFADFIFFPLLLLGIENVAVVPNVTINRVVGHDIGYSHSLLMLVIWAVLFAVVYFWRLRQVRVAALLFAVVLSHWLLDVISHRPDMPLVPGGKTLFGLGLWNSIPATLLVEGGFWLLAVVMYSRFTRPKNRLGIFAFWIGAMLLTLVWFGNINASMDPDRVSGGIGGLISFSLVTVWAFWIDRLRESRV
ncbi:MAG: metal-dependent hydrolase [Pyrinomonadaceae bacterium]